MSPLPLRGIPPPGGINGKRLLFRLAAAGFHDLKNGTFAAASGRTPGFARQAPQVGPPRGPRVRFLPFKPFAARWQTSAYGKQTEPIRCLSESHSLRIRQRGPGQQRRSSEPLMGVWGDNPQFLAASIGVWGGAPASDKGREGGFKMIKQGPSRISKFGNSGGPRRKEPAPPLFL